MSQVDPKIPEEMADDVLAIASRLYAEASDSYSVQELQAAGKEVSIPPELIEQAIREVKEKRRQAELDQQQAAERQRTFKWIGIGVGTAAILWGIFSYNSLSSSRQDVNAAWAEIDNQLQRRADLIPNLAATAKVQAQQEQQLVNSLSQARAGYLNSNSPEEKIQASVQMDAAIQQFSQSVLANPQQPVSQAFVGLQDELAGTQNRISVAKRRYNEAVRNHNETLNSFPNSIIGSIFGFEEKQSIEAKNRENPNVKELLK
ncbi:MAG: LemA family protein [Microcoleaceae cyanobacterium]